MDWLGILGAAFIIIPLVQLVRILLSDCDLSLWWAERFGKKPEDLAGQVVWITGASSGIGEELAYRLARAKCKLVLSARREGELQRVKKQCLLHGKLGEKDVLVLPLDMLDYSSHQTALVEVLQHFDKIDILVNNAGRSQRALAVKTSLKVDREILELNTLGVLSLTKAVLPHMMERKAGLLVVTSSVGGRICVPFSASYSMSKFALHGWFESLRLEVLPDNVKICMVCPGPVFSNLLQEAFTEESGKVFGQEMKLEENRMTTEHCVDLMAVAIANQMPEVWLSKNPVLFLTYGATYMPTIARWISGFFGHKAIKRLREGQERQ